MSRALTRCPVCGREMARPGRYKLQLFREEGQRGYYYFEYDMSTYLCKRCGHAVKRLLKMLREEGSGMAEELKPCPFCGGEARIIANHYVPKFCVGCDDDTCLGFSGLGWLYDSEQEAAEAWNRRAERTCRDIDHMHDAIKCSECGETTLNTLYRVESGDGLMTVKGHRPRFCSNCGSRLVDE